jgi:potassium-transporting ATPase KdpC subunit
MRRALLTSIRLAAVTIVAFGLIYPMVVWATSALVFPSQAGGSAVKKGGRVVGSSLIGQAFTSDRYFHPRPSAAGDGYDAMASGASNLGPTNRELVAAVRARVREVERREGAKRGTVPVDLVTSSGSGLDPHISPDSAYLQVVRVARARGLSEARVRALVAERVEPRQLGILGEPRVNVLELNLALDALSSR